MLRLSVDEVRIASADYGHHLCVIFGNSECILAILIENIEYFDLLLKTQTLHHTQVEHWESALMDRMVVACNRCGGTATDFAHPIQTGPVYNYFLRHRWLLR